MKAGHACLDEQTLLHPISSSSHLTYYGKSVPTIPPSAPKQSVCMAWMMDRDMAWAGGTVHWHNLDHSAKYDQFSIVIFLFPDPTGKQYMLHNEWTNGFHGSYALQMFKEKFF